jgi:hypothetical protein
MRTGPTGAVVSAPIQWWSATKSVYIWYDAERRDPYFDVPDVFAGFDDGSSVADYYPMATLYRERLELHPQYVLENGVDFAHFKFVHKTPIVPVFTRHDFDRPVSYVDFTITFEGDDGQSIEDVKSGVEAINGGLGVAVTKSWGMVDNRTITAVTPSTTAPPTFVSVCTSAARPAPIRRRRRGRRKSSPKRSFASSPRTFTSGNTSATPTRPHSPAASTRASPPSAIGPSSSTPTAVAAVPPNCGPPSQPHQRSDRRTDIDECTHQGTDPGIPGRHRQRRL